MGAVMQVQVRPAESADLDALAAFEVAEARRRFGSHAVTDLARERSKLAKSLRRPDQAMAVALDGDGLVAGWLWLASKTNFLTGDRYLNCRTLARSVDAPADVIDCLVGYAVAYARQHGIHEIVGQVTVDQDTTRERLMASGFEPTHLRMALDLS
jgi:ribosomal protein S18 acetylase RimI-like enzyme